MYSPVEFREPLEFLVTCRLLLTGLKPIDVYLWHSNLTKNQGTDFLFLYCRDD